MSTSILTEFQKKLFNLCTSYQSSDNLYEVVLNTELYDDFQRLINQYGMQFSVRDSEKYEENSAKKLWSSRTIKYFGTPFVIEKQLIMHCAYGPKYHNTPNQNVFKHDRPTGKMKQFRQQFSKKIGCSANMRVTFIKTFPEFQIKGVKNLKDEKYETMKILKNELENGVEVKTERVCHISFSVETAHCHPVWTTFLNQELNSELEKEIQRLVNSGTANVQTLKVMLRDCVKNNIDGNVCTTLVAPSSESFLSACSTVSQSDSYEGISPGVVPPSALMSSVEESVSIAEIRELAKNVYDRSLLLRSESVDLLPIKRKFIDLFDNMNNYIHKDTHLNIPILPFTSVGVTKNKKRKSKVQ